MSSRQETPQNTMDENLYQARCGDCHWFRKTTKTPTGANA